MNMRRICTGVMIIVLMLTLGVSAAAQWTNSVSEDPMTGAKSYYAHSPATASVERMSFPYHDTTATLNVGCDGKSEWAYIAFSNAPNIVNTTIKNGYNLIQTRIRWNDKVESVTLSQGWGSEFLHFSDGKSAISRIAGSDTMLLELNWFGEGMVYFKFFLAGSSAAISKMRSLSGAK